MTGARTMLSLAKDYLSERRALGFALRMQGHQITAFALFADERGHSGPLTNDIVLNWVQGQAKRASLRRGASRPFARSRGILPGSIPAPSFHKPRPLVVHIAASHRTSIRSRRSATL
ncbi:hypothetical protein NKH37_33685 [Mesorhizobium sp. M1217]|uniref:hypothetical protein n=1 Tax=Mesorhizobium sp. M1217 TaxID=2957070 RepID=UPI00333C8E60